MEKVILTTSQLNQLAYHHPTLSPSFGGTFPCDGLPDHPPRDRDEGYIVNTDPTGEPGRHWLGLWVSGNACELFDSFALDLDTYETTEPLKTWLTASIQVRDAKRTERAIVAQSELRRTRPHVSGGQIARTEPVGVSKAMVSSRLRGQRPSRGSMGQRLDHERTSLAEGGATPGRTRHVPIERGRASSVLRSIVLRSR